MKSKGRDWSNELFPMRVPFQLHTKRPRKVQQQQHLEGQSVLLYGSPRSQRGQRRRRRPQAPTWQGGVQRDILLDLLHALIAASQEPLRSRALRTLLKVCERVYTDPMNDRFHTLDVSNSHVQEVLSVHGMEGCLLCIGFERSNQSDAGPGRPRPLKLPLVKAIDKRHMGECVEACQAALEKADLEAMAQKRTLAAASLGTAVPVGSYLERELLALDWAEGGAHGLQSEWLHVHALRIQLAWRQYQWWMSLRRQARITLPSPLPSPPLSPAPEGSRDECSLSPPKAAASDRGKCVSEDTPVEQPGDPGLLDQKIVAPIMFTSPSGLSLLESRVESQENNHAGETKREASCAGPDPNPGPDLDPTDGRQSIIPLADELAGRSSSLKGRGAMLSSSSSSSLLLHAPSKADASGAATTSVRDNQPTIAADAPPHGGGDDTPLANNAGTRADRLSALRSRVALDAEMEAAVASRTIASQKKKAARTLPDSSSLSPDSRGGGTIANRSKQCRSPSSPANDHWSMDAVSMSKSISDEHDTNRNEAGAGKKESPKEATRSPTNIDNCDGNRVRDDDDVEAKTMEPNSNAVNVEGMRAKGEAEISSVPTVLEVIDSCEIKAAAAAAAATTTTTTTATVNAGTGPPTSSLSLTSASPSVAPVASRSIPSAREAREARRKVKQQVMSSITGKEIRKGGGRIHTSSSSSSSSLSKTERSGGRNASAKVQPVDRQMSAAMPTSGPKRCRIKSQEKIGDEKVVPAEDSFEAKRRDKDSSTTSDSVDDNSNNNRNSPRSLKEGTLPASSTQAKFAQSRGVLGKGFGGSTSELCNKAAAIAGGRSGDNSGESLRLPAISALATTPLATIGSNEGDAAEAVATIAVPLEAAPQPCKPPNREGMKRRNMDRPSLGNAVPAGARNSSDFDFESPHGSMRLWGELKTGSWMRKR